MKALEGKKGAAGFTLIEMAIVLVVIGLIIGAVLKGQDLIANARAKKFANFVRSIEVGEWTYFDRNGKFTYGTGLLVGAIPTASNSTTIGANTYYAMLGKNNTKSSIVIVRSAAWPATPLVFTPDDLNFVKSFDAAVDGLTDGKNGRVQAITAVGTMSSNGTFSGTISADANGWSTSTTKGMIYDFD